jgi:hypothetical protein
MAFALSLSFAVASSMREITGVGFIALARRSSQRENPGFFNGLKLPGLNNDLT